MSVDDVDDVDCSWTNLPTWYNLPSGEKMVMLLSKPLLEEPRDMATQEWG